MYRSIGIDASFSNFGDICESYMDEQLRNDLQPLSKNCFTRRFEHWAEKIRLSKVRSGTRIVVSGHEALIYDGAEPEKAALYRWSVAPGRSPRNRPAEARCQTMSPRPRPARACPTYAP